MPTAECHSCGAKYKVPETSLGKKAKCKKCDSVFTLADAVDGVIPIAMAEDDDGGFTGSAFAAEAAAIAQAKADSATAAAVTLPVAGPVSSASTTSKPLAEQPSVSKGYWDNLLWTILFPADPRNLVMFLVLWAFLGFVTLVVWFPTFGIIMLFAKIIGGVLLYGMYCGYRLSIVEGAAAGDSQLPNMSVDWLDDAVIPFFQWIGSWGVVIAPSVIHLILEEGVTSPLEIAGIWGAAFSAPAKAWAASPIATVLIYLGLFFWPIIILTVALGGFGSLTRVDLVFKTVIKSFPAYAATVALVALATIADSFASARITGKMTAGQTNLVSLIGWGMVAQFLILGPSVYFTIVSLRAIGLYYHHFKHRFAWDWG